MAAVYDVSARVARDWVFGSSTSLLLLVGRAEQRRWRRIYRVLRDEEQRQRPIKRCSNFLCTLPDGQALASMVGDDTPDVRSNFSSARLTAGTRVFARLQPIMYRDDGDVLRCRLTIIDLWPSDPLLNVDARPFYPPPALGPHAEDHETLPPPYDG